MSSPDDKLLTESESPISDSEMLFEIIDHRPFYFPGDDVHCVIRVKFPTEKRLWGIWFFLNGVETVRFNSHKKTRKCCHGLLRIYGNKRNIKPDDALDFNSKEIQSHKFSEHDPLAITLNARKEYHYRVHFTLPKDIPPTVNHKKIQVSYKISAMLDVPWGLSYATHRELTIGAPIPKPDSTLFSERASFLHMPSNHNHFFKIQVDVGKLYILPGTLSEVNVYLENNSSRNISGLKFKLKQYIILSDEIHEEHTLYRGSTLNDPKNSRYFPLGKGSTSFTLAYSVNSGISDVPTTLNAGLFRIQYTLIVTAIVSMASDVAVKIPIHVLNLSQLPEGLAEYRKVKKDKKNKDKKENKENKDKEEKKDKKEERDKKEEPKTKDTKQLAAKNEQNAKQGQEKGAEKSRANTPLEKSSDLINFDDIAEVGTFEVSRPTGLAPFQLPKNPLFAVSSSVPSPQGSVSKETQNFQLSFSQVLNACQSSLRQASLHCEKGVHLASLNVLHKRVDLKPEFTFSLNGLNSNFEELLLRMPRLEKNARAHDEKLFREELTQLAVLANRLQLQVIVSASFLGIVDDQKYLLNTSRNLFDHLQQLTAIASNVLQYSRDSPFNEEHLSTLLATTLIKAQQDTKNLIEMFKVAFEEMRERYQQMKKLIEDYKQKLAAFSNSTLAKQEVEPQVFAQTVTQAKAQSQELARSLFLGHLENFEHGKIAIPQMEQLLQQAVGIEPIREYVLKSANDFLKIAVISHSLLEHGRKIVLLEERSTEFKNLFSEFALSLRAILTHLQGTSVQEEVTKQFEQAVQVVQLRIQETLKLLAAAQQQNTMEASLFETKSIAHNLEVIHASATVIHSLNNFVSEILKEHPAYTTGIEQSLKNLGNKIPELQREVAKSTVEEDLIIDALQYIARECLFLASHSMSTQLMTPYLQMASAIQNMVEQLHHCVHHLAQTKENEDFDFVAPIGTPSLARIEKQHQRNNSYHASPSIQRLGTPRKSVIKEDWSSLIQE